jgi:hypothetical protein
LKKIARGIYFREQGKQLADDKLLLFRDQDVKMAYRSITQNWPEVDMGETFRYRSIHSPEGSMIWFEFYRFNWWLALTGNEAKTYPLKSGSACGCCAQNGVLAFFAPLESSVFSAS